MRMHLNYSKGRILFRDGGVYLGPRMLGRFKIRDSKIVFTTERNVMNHFFALYSGLGFNSELIDLVGSSVPEMPVIVEYREIERKRYILSTTIGEIKEKGEKVIPVKGFEQQYVLPMVEFECEEKND